MTPTAIATTTAVVVHDVAAARGPFGGSDDAIRDSLAYGDIAKVKLGRGGRSVAFKITLEDGTVGYYKPEQTFAAHWYSEVASWYVDRALGLHRVPPAVGRRIAWSELSDAARGSKHVDEVVVGADGTVRGSFVWWVPDKLVPFAPPPGWAAWLSIDPPPAVSPFQRAADYRRARKRGRLREPGPPAFADRPAELSDLVLFDFLIGNHDRWGGRFTNVRTIGKDGPLVHIDNANGFHGARPPDARARAQLAAVQKMRKSTIAALRTLDIDRLRRALARDPLAPVLTDAHLEGLEDRRQRIVAHAEEMLRIHGEAATPW